MPIYAPARRINPTIRRRESARKEVMAGLYLTSMVDMFAILVIFLLNSFSAEGELIVLPRNLELPKAENVGTVEVAPSLVIAKDRILFENTVVADTSKVMEQENWEMPDLQEALRIFKDSPAAKKVLDQALQRALISAPQDLSEEDLQKLKEEETAKILRRVNISADRSLPFHVIKKVIYNASFVGYPDFRFSVFAGKAAAQNP